MADLGFNGLGTALNEYRSVAWAILNYSTRDVNAAGRVLADPSCGNLDEALSIIGNYRAAHSFPLNTFQTGLRKRAKAVDTSCIISQRLKRISSIQFKLRTFETMRLAQMQDIGGCRAVMRSIAAVRQVVDLYTGSELKHSLRQIDDYITQPKPSGYRGIHLIYRYHSDRKSTYNGLQIEVQLRSRLQHAWATAVETVGTFVRQALKSSQGEREWLRFFALMGTAIAKRESAPICPGTPTQDGVLRRELRALASSLDVKTHLQAFGAALRVFEQPEGTYRNDHYFLLQLDAMDRNIRVSGYKQADLPYATIDYLEAEKRLKDRGDAVLVSVESLDSLRRAYPNYFLDTSVFIDALQKALE